MVGSAVDSCLDRVLSAQSLVNRMGRESGNTIWTQGTFLTSFGGSMKALLGTMLKVELLPGGPTGAATVL